MATQSGRPQGSIDSSSTISSMPVKSRGVRTCDVQSSIVNEIVI